MDKYWEFKCYTDSIRNPHDEQIVKMYLKAFEEELEEKEKEEKINRLIYETLIRNVTELRTNGQNPSKAIYEELKNGGYLK